MGKKLDILLMRRGFKTSKFKATANMAISRLAVLKNQRQARCSIARSDVIELLNTSNHERALLRVEQVIKQQNMLDVFVVLESYCHLLIERVHLIAQEKVCPEELKEVVSSLIFAATRCGEFPELQEMRLIFTTRFGKEFANRAIELRNHCGVNPQVIQKLSTRIPSLETKMKVLKEIAAENNIVLQIDSATTEGNQDPTLSAAPSGISTPRENRPIHLGDMEMGGEFTGSGEMRRKYRDVADAAQAAFESAAYAAEAARAAVELSRSQSTDPDDPTTPNNRPRKVSVSVRRVKSEILTSEENIMPEEEMETEKQIEKTHLMQDSGSESIPGTVSDENRADKFKHNDSDSSSDSPDDYVNEVKMAFKEDDHIKPQGKEIFFNESDNEIESKGKMTWTYDSDADENNDIVVEGSSRKFFHSAHSPLRFSMLKMDSGPGNSHIEPLNINRRPISVRTRLGYVQ